ncbi:MAG: hypothetical protein ACYTEK_13590, partial [Planctomycetota bacterium]
MRDYLSLRAFGICLVGLLLVASQTFAVDELVSNPRFEGVEELPEGWSVWEPAWEKAACRVGADAGGGLLIDGADPFAVGGVTQDIKGVQGGKAYAIKAECQLRDVPAAYHSLLVRISWTRGGKSLHPAGMLVGGPVVDGAQARFDDVLVAPEEADGAKLSLEVKWLRGGSVLWKQVSVREAPAPGPRKVKVGTVYLRPKNSTP